MLASEMTYRRARRETSHPVRSDWRSRRENSYALGETRTSKVDWFCYPPTKTARLILVPKETEEAKFNRLVNEWHEETDMYSSTPRVTSHSAYLKIIAMGHNAIPLILREMKVRPGHWLPAIEAVTENLREPEENPARGCLRSSEARAAWVRWGESKGYL